MYPSLEQRSISGRQRRIWSPGNDPFNKGSGGSSAFLGGKIECTAGQDEEDEPKRSDSTASSRTSTSSKSLFLHQVDSAVLYHVVVLMMDYLSNADKVTVDKCNVEDLKELWKTILTCLIALTSAKDEDELGSKPAELRYNHVNTTQDSCLIL